MEWVVTTGRTVEEAKEAALDELGVDEVDAEFEILEEPRQGLFGRQRGEARVRARVRPTAPRPKIDRRDRRRRGAERSRGERPAADATEALGASGEPAGAPVAVMAAGKATGDAGPSSPAGKRRDRRERPDRPGRPVAIGDAGEAPTGESGRDDEEMGAPVSEETSLTLAEQGEVAREFMAGLLARFGTGAEIAVVELDEDTVEVRVTGADLGLLIGPKGQTLTALQDLTRTVVQRRTPGRTGRLVLDVAGYRQRRREALERFARQVAADVIASGVQRVLEPMSAADRKVVHDTANEIDGVRTVSEGEEPRRRVVILPDSAATA